MIKELLELGICFAVVVSNPKFIADSTYGSREYFILIKNEDVPINISPDQIEDDLAQIDLPENEVEYFRKISEELFDRVHHTDDGRVYELKENSFKTYIN